MYDIHSNIDNIVDRVNAIVSEYFKCSPEELYSRSKRGNISCARNLAYFYLHDIIGVSTNKVASIYKRTQQQIKAQNAKTRFLVYNDEYFKQVFCYMDEEYKRGRL